MSTKWRWKIEEVIDRLCNSYDYIGRKTGGPFLALVYPPEAEPAVLSEWHTQADALRPDFDVRTVNVLDVTQGVLDEIGVEAVVDGIENPMPGSEAEEELGLMWADAVADATREQFEAQGDGLPVVSLERMAALYPVAGPRAIMQNIRANGRTTLEVPVVLLVPGEVKETRTYRFVRRHEELMYRGDVI